MTDKPHDSSKNGAEAIESSPNGETETEADATLNLRGKKCPDTFVQAKLALEELDDDGVLRVVIDDPQAAERLPRNMKNHGQEIVSVKQIEEHLWHILIQKKKEGGPKRWILVDG